MSVLHTVKVKQNGISVSTTLEGERVIVHHSNRCVTIAISESNEIFYNESFCGESLEDINKELEIMDININI